MQFRTVALVGLLGVTLGWAVGTRVQPGQSAASGQSSSGPRPLGTATPASSAPFTEQLRLKLEQKPRVPRAARNPFIFGTRRPAAVAPPASAPPSLTTGAPVVEPPPSASAEALDLRLTGMASTAVNGGVEWTALINDGQSLLFAKLGDRLPGGFEVVDIQESAVTIRDTAGAERVLRLR